MLLLSFERFCFFLLLIVNPYACVRFRHKLFNKTCLTKGCLSTEKCLFRQMLEAEDDRLVKNEVCNKKNERQQFQLSENLAFLSNQVGANLTGQISAACYDNDEAYLQEDNTFSSGVVALNFVLMVIEDDKKYWQIRNSRNEKCLTGFYPLFKTQFNTCLEKKTSIGYDKFSAQLWIIEDFVVDRSRSGDQKGGCEYYYE
jgi:hypothetical protein